MIKQCLYRLSGTNLAGRFSRHNTVNYLIKHTLGSLDLPSIFEPRGLYRTDGKCSDGVTMIPWELDKQLEWDVTVLSAPAHSPRRVFNPWNIQKANQCVESDGGGRLDRMSLHECHICH